MRLYPYLALATLSITAACAGPSVGGPSAERPGVDASMPAEQTAYTRALAAQLRAEAQEAWDTRHDAEWSTSLSKRAERAVAGRPMEPVSAPLADSDRADAGALASASRTLYTDLEFGARSISPVATARADGMLACWALGAQAKGNDALNRDRREAGAHCRDAAQAALVEISDHAEASNIQALPTTVLFPMNGAQLNIEQGAQLRETVGQMHQGHVLHVLRLGPVGQSSELFEDRVLAANDILVRFGIPANRIGVRTLDGLRPVTPSRTPPYDGRYWVVMEPAL